MKRILKNITAFVGTALICFSCSDFLDIEPKDKFTEKDVFSNMSSLNAYVTQRYTGMKDGFSRQAFRNACDEGWNTHNWDGTNAFQRGQMTPDFDANLGIWSNYYFAIRGCNIFFQNLELVNSLKTDADNIKKIDQYTGEMYFLRAFYYADLVKYYGGVPIITRTFEIDTPKEELILPRDSYEDCVKFIVSELDSAILKLPVKYEDNQLGRATKGAAMALKSRVLLYAASPYWNPNNEIEPWIKARDAASDLINLNTDGGTVGGTKVYSLDPDYKGLFLNIQSSEIIFMRLFSTEFGHYFDSYNSPNGYYGYSDTSVSQNLVDSYEMADGSMPDANTLYGNGQAGKEYGIGVTPWDGREPRFYHSIVCDGQQYRGREVEFFTNSYNVQGGLDSNVSDREKWNAPKTGFVIRKFMNEKITETWNLRSNAPWIYMRLGEIYLNYAEALYNTGDEAGARAYIEKIRNRARGGRTDVLPEITDSGKDLLDKIKHERRIELVFEEHRFFDVRRWRDAVEIENRSMLGVIIKKASNGKKTYSVNVIEKECKFSEQHYLFPIPRYEMDKNNKFVQNPKYN